MSKSSLKERQKAIRKAWEREQRAVSEGKGTRDWSPEQQKDILDPNKGKAYDESGRAFEGQHMKSAAEYPEYQGDPNNIQFLTREEHLEAHKGSWQNPTNWYYDPVTKEYVDFGDGEIIPCKEIELTDPISKIVGTTAKENTVSESVSIKKPSDDKDDPSKKKRDATLPPSKDKRQTPSKKSTQVQNTVIKKPKPAKRLIKCLKAGGERVLRSIADDPERVFYIASFIKDVVETVSSESSSSSYANSVKSPDMEPSSSLKSGLDKKVEAINERSNRSSPREHNVSGYDRMQNGKIVHVDPYKRGGKKD